MPTFNYVTFGNSYKNKIAEKAAYFAKMYGAPSSQYASPALYFEPHTPKAKPLSRGDQYKETSVTTVRVPKKGQGKCVKCSGIMDLTGDGINEDENALEYVADPYLKAVEDKVVLGHWCPKCYIKRKKEIPQTQKVFIKPANGPWEAFGHINVDSVQFQPLDFETTDESVYEYAIQDASISTNMYKIMWDGKP